MTIITTQASIDDPIFFSSPLYITSFYTKSEKIMYYCTVESNDLRYNILNENLSVEEDFIIYNGNDRILKIAGPVESGNLYETSHPFTQTLFNNDDNFEFLVLNIIESENSDGYTVKYYKSVSIVSSGKDGVGSNSRVIATIPLPFNGEPVSAYTFQIKEFTYLVFYTEYDNKKLGYACYKIIKDGSSTVELEEASKSLIFPNPVEKGQTLTMIMDKSKITSNSFLQITNLDGKTVNIQKINADSETVSIPSNISSGQYVYSVISNSKIIDTGKIIVK